MTHISLPMRNVAIGIDDFKEIREKDLYYVDKTGLIEDIVARNGTKVFLLTRPRRFGKSLNLSMIDAFFNLRYKGNTWFESLHVMGCDGCTAVMNTYPVITVDLKGLNLDDMDSFLASFAVRISQVCYEHKYVLDSDVDDVKLAKFDKLRNERGSRVDLEGSLKLISDVLYEYHGKPVMVLIDEYDNPIQNSYGTDMQPRIIGFMRNLLTNVLKTNPSLEFGVVTGVMQIAKESIFSGLNN
ncbi:MAG: AAA family ATPase, partial [Candidatus Methanomethylophilaceae archaeon]|nr:AAA family ATPase [Candidatus Methanomethylophilaceae archaeon]